MLEASDLPYKVLIPSRGRAKIITNHPLLHVSNVFVRSEEEREEYSEEIAKAGKRVHAIHVISDYDTLPEKRQRILDEYWSDDEPFAMMVDDDLKSGKPMFHLRNVGNLTPDQMLTLFWRSYQTAADIPTGLFGYSLNANPAIRSINLPFGALNGEFVTVTYGILDRELRYDLNMAMFDDIDISYQCLEKYRFLCRDERFVFVCPYYTEGGLSNQRSSSVMYREIGYLIQKWGSDLIKRSEEFNLIAKINIRT